MNALIRNHRQVLKCAYSSSAFYKNSKYSTTHYRSHLTLKDRVREARQHYLGGVVVGHHVVPKIRYAPMSSVSYSYETKPHINTPHHNCPTYHTVRGFHFSLVRYENPSSKVEVTVQSMKNKQKEKVEEIMKEAAAAANGPTTATATATVTTTTNATGATSSSSTTVSANAAAATSAATQAVASQTQPTAALDANGKAAPPAVVKKSLKTKIWEEILHYYHGFRLLFVDINICRKLLMRVLNGKTLTRRENKLLVRTTSDLFRLIPFSVFIIVPFMELLLPVFIKFFPGMLPSTFQTAKEREDKLKQSLQVRLEMAKFLQKTLDEMAVQHKEHKSEEAKQFVEFFQKIKDPNEYVSNDEIIKFAKRFEDEITLDSLSRVQLAALCRVLELNTMGTSNFLRFQLRVKLRSLAADDRVIAREGVSALDLFELQQACKSRGMRAYGLTAERLRAQLKEWIDLSLNEKVPPTLLLLSRAMLISDDTIITDKLKETMRVLPDSVAAKTKAAIGESEGKIDNKTKIEIIKEEERKIKEERDEEREDQKAKQEILLDKAIAEDAAAAKVVPPPFTSALHTPMQAPSKIDTPATAAAASDSISSKDAELLSEALQTLSSDKNKLMVEKEAIKDLKEELEDYKEDVQELREVRDVVQEPVHESRAAKMLYKKVDKMIGQLDTVLADLEQKQHQIQEKHQVKGEVSPITEALKRREEELIHIDELVQTIKKLKQTSDQTRLKSIEKVLSKMDSDKDGVITVDEVLKVIEAISRDNVQLDEKQLEELITLLDKEQLIEAEEKIEKALARSIKEEEKTRARKREEALKQAEAAARAAAEELNDSAPELKDTATDLDLDTKKNVICAERSKEPCLPEAAILEAADKQKDKIIPKADIAATMPPTIPPPPTTSTQVNPKDKML